MTLRELIAGAKAKQKYEWDHTAELLALHASLQTKTYYSRDHFHPMRETPTPAYNLDDPGAEYERLMKGKK